MKKLQTLIIFLFSIGISAQNITEINSDLNISDSLTHKAEIRIYSSGGITNHSSIFRMFKNNSDKWIAEYYDHYAKVNGQTELRVEKRTLKSKNDMEFIFQNLNRSYILDLPSLREIKWKLGTRGQVEKIETKHKGKTILEYEYSTRKIGILDGIGIKIQAKDLNKTNEFEYSNPEAYLKHYPEIDELIYVSEILNLIRSEFEIWKK